MLVFCFTGLTAVSAQSLNPQMQRMMQQAKGESRHPQKSGIKLNPSSKFNVQPKDVAAFMNSGNRAVRHSAARQEKIAAQANVADSVLLYGLNFNDNTWQTQTELPGKIYSFGAAPVISYHEESAGELDQPMAAFYAKGDFYLLTSAMDDDGLVTSTMTTYDASTWKKKDTHTLVEKSEDMELYFRQVGVYDPTTDKAYTMSWGEGKPLISIDLKTKETKAIGQVNKFIQTLFVDNTGQLYGIAFNDKTLYKIDKTSAQASEVGKLDIGFNLSADPMSAVTDPATGKVYWVAVNGDSKASALYTLNTATAHAEKIIDMPGNEHFLGLYIPDTEAKAPAAVSGISLKDGKFNFTVPEKTYTSGETLTGELTASIAVEGGKTIETKVAPGEHASVDLAQPDGPCIINVSVSNSAGRSPLRRLETYVGQDVPSAVGNLTLSIEDGKTASLSWTTPTSALHGGPVDDASVNYRIVRYPDETVVAEGLKENSFSETVPEAHARYYYEVTACSGDRRGGVATSNTVTAGSTWFAPYTETFETQSDFDSFKVVDANKDGHTWSFMDQNGQNGIAYLTGNGTRDVDTGEYTGHGNDDYLITPSISLKKGVDYRVRFDSGNQWYEIEHMDILLGKKQDVTGDETNVASLDVHSETSYTVKFNVPEDGKYNLLFHSDNPGESVNMVLDNISLDVYAAFEGPDSVSDVSVKAGEKGALTNTLSFKTPSTTYHGGVLGAITHVDVYRNGSAKPVKVFENPKTGETLSWTDADVSQGSVTYRIVAFNDKGQGKEALITNWVGLDMPSNVTNLKVKMNSDNKAVVTYDQVSGVGKHGGYVDPDQVKYVLCRYNEYNWDNHWEAVTDSTTGFTLTDESFDVSYGERQQYVDYLLVAANSAGTSDGAGAGIVLGEPYERPYTESFKDGAIENKPWTLSASSYNYAWNAVTGSGLAVKPYDNDGGMLQFKYIQDESNTQVIMGPRVSLAASKAAELSFFMYHGFEAEEGDLTLNVWTNYDDEGWKKTADVEYNNGSDGWSRFSLPLRSDARDVQIAFGAHAADASAAIYIDHIKIDESTASDLAIESVNLSKKRVEAGEKTDVTVSVANYGTTKAEGYKVVLLRDGVAADSKTGSAIEQNSRTKVSFEIATTKEDAMSSHLYSAAIEYAADTNAANDSSASVKLFVHGSNLPVAENLSGSVAGGKVVLNWSKPSTAEVADTVTDGFDEYESFIIDNIGDWKTYDGDGTQTVYFGGPQVANAYEPKAWQVWAPEEAGFSLEKFPVLTPHSGTKYLSCWAASDGVSQTLPNDDWLISSEVKGGTDVSFYYRMPNEGSDPQVFEMLYSTTDREPENFTAFDRDSIVAGTDWVKFEYTLPADARYFALRSCSRGSYTVAFLDDITYTPLYGSTSPVTFEGYNVYRDNERIAEGITTTGFTDSEASAGKHVYHVTAVWKEGESNYSNSYVCDTTDGISKTPGAAAADIVTRNGLIVINGAEGRHISVCNAAGQMLFNGRGNAVNIIRATRGVNVVSIDGVTTKVVVK